MAGKKIVVDIGNTLLKYGVFENKQLLQLGVLEQPEGLAAVLHAFKPVHAIVASVARPAADLWPYLPVPGKKLELNWQTPLPIQNLYKTPQTLGADRLAGVIGAKQLFPQRPCLVIDAGTCITYDFITAAGDYLGGSISPGLQMKFKAVHTFTGRLPLVQQTEEVPLTGQNTQEAIQSGVVNGTVAELNGIIDYYKQQAPALVTILCGGDAVFFETKLKGSIFVIPELVLIGLNSILDHNV
ncbi:MAG: type III pantothenate kinase [Hymenobacteraceae bacterium]|nr:type III pantothenate kinase [Hymenobacteraceae bacterium]MDX5398052.1 type III pantothenate kinase [Hymenobacteraceae bacterium]MDX5443601.1 type III pantothenate kinase [Hymenobacteraceae bacterium]MDX5514123.1 type III pantothenate kinase [Hymenobacteraceae bacterium]